MAMSVRRFRSYPAYKDSGVEWLGEIPKHWEVKRLKTVASVQLSNVDKNSVEGQESVRLCNYVDVYYNERITGDIDFMAATATPEQVRRFSLRAGDVLITKDSESWTDIAVSAVVAEDLPGVLCGYHLAHIRPDADCDGAFLSRAFAAVGPRDQFQIAANGITRFGLGGDAIRTGLFAVPPRVEQHPIAAFLDRETAKIDALVAKKERVIELLQEKRTALITRAVTKGLDPNVPMKDSGVEWLGGIPVHWERKRLKFLVNYVTSGSRGWAEFYADDGPIFLRIGNVSGEGIDLCLEDVQRVDPPLGAEGERTRTQAGDLLVSITANIGAVAVVTSGLGDAYVNQHLALTRPVHRILFPRWGAYFLSSASGQPQFKILIQGGTKEGLGLDDVKNLDLLVPPYEEQRRIAEFLDAQSERIRTLITRVREAIERLKEYRTALISAAVTGKIDVRGEVA
jgi:type I restriction enzyme S subunit